MDEQIYGHDMDGFMIVKNDMDDMDDMIYDMNDMAIMAMEED